MEELNLGLKSEKIHENGMNFFQRVIGIIVSPGKTMEDLVKKPRILFPILSTALSVVLFYLIRFDLYKPFFIKTLQTALEQSGKPVPAEQMDFVQNVSLISGLAAIPFSNVIMLIIVSSIIFGICRLIFKCEGKYKQYLSVTGYSYVIMLLSIIVTLGASFFTNSIMLDASLANITNILAPNIKGSFLYGIIRGIDLFSIWYYIVMGIGVVTVSKLSKVKVFSIMGLFFIAQVLYTANSFKLM